MWIDYWQCTRGSHSLSRKDGPLSIGLQCRPFIVSISAQVNMNIVRSYKFLFLYKCIGFQIHWEVSFCGCLTPEPAACWQAREGIGQNLSALKESSLNSHWAASVLGLFSNLENQQKSSFILSVSFSLDSRVLFNSRSQLASLFMEKWIALNEMEWEGVVMVLSECSWLAIIHRNEICLWLEVVCPLWKPVFMDTLLKYKALEVWRSGKLRPK